MSTGVGVGSGLAPAGVGAFGFTAGRGGVGATGFDAERAVVEAEAPIVADGVDAVAVDDMEAGVSTARGGSAADGTASDVTVVAAPLEACVAVAGLRASRITAAAAIDTPDAPRAHPTQRRPLGARVEAETAAARCAASLSSAVVAVAAAAAGGGDGDITRMGVGGAARTAFSTLRIATPSASFIVRALAKRRSFSNASDVSRSCFTELGSDGKRVFIGGTGLVIVRSSASFVVAASSWTRRPLTRE